MLVAGLCGLLAGCSGEPETLAKHDPDAAISNAFAAADTLPAQPLPAALSQVVAAPRPHVVASTRPRVAPGKSDLLVRPRSRVIAEAATESRQLVAAAPAQPDAPVATSQIAAAESEHDPLVHEEARVRQGGGGYYSVGKRYQMAGKWYQPKEEPGYNEVGMSSWYGADFHGKLTANGEIFDRTSISAAHPTLPLPSYVRVTNLRNDRSIVVRVNDRGPYAHNRLIDVSEQTAALLGFRRKGLTRVRVEYISKAPLDGETKGELLATYRGPSPTIAPGVMLASERARLPRPRIHHAVAYAPATAKKPPAMAALDSLTVSPSAAERILIAFRAADTVAE